MSPTIRRLAWFVALWGASVTVMAAVAFMLRAVLRFATS